MTTRRTFCFQSFGLLLQPYTIVQTPGTNSGASSTSRPDVAALDRDRILWDANRFLAERPQTITSIRAPDDGDPHLYYAQEDTDEVGHTDTGTRPDFAAHRDLLDRFTLQMPGLTAAYLLTREQDPKLAGTYAQLAVQHLKAWFVDPVTRMDPSIPSRTPTEYKALVQAVGLAEVAVAVPFLSGFEGFSAADLAAVRAWFNSYLSWLTTSRTAGLARDSRDHHASSWLLQASSSARLAGTDEQLAELRHFYKATAVRAQIVADGNFPHELQTANPYRNSLFNLDLLAGSIDLLSSRFESLWEFQLQDGPGMRVAMARDVPFIRDRGAWPYRADASHFADLPGRRPSLLFAARAYQRPEYASLWASLRPDPASPEIMHSFPIRQPLLWVTRPPLLPALPQSRPARGR